MNPQFWKLSQGPDHFGHEEILSSIEDRLVYVHRTTGPMGRSGKSQASEFMNADIGDYFYLTNGNKGIYILGQFIGPANVFSRKEDGWLDRPFRLIRPSRSRDSYNGKKKWWTPNENSTFVPVPEDEMDLFERQILRPYFDIRLEDFGIEKTN